MCVILHNALYFAGRVNRQRLYYVEMNRLESHAAQVLYGQKYERSNADGS